KIPSKFLFHLSLISLKQAVTLSGLKRETRSQARLLTIYVQYLFNRVQFLLNSQKLRLSLTAKIPILRG
ncbi:MAG: hypothetical protein ACLUVT_03495, partial [Parasutterella excrementihominis]|uniref:hypothetical protein n=1 Tax=Parasutterella TaxID=577310 RepID=UPI00399B4C50